MICPAGQIMQIQCVRGAVSLSAHSCGYSSHGHAGLEFISFVAAVQYAHMLAK